MPGPVRSAPKVADWIPTWMDPANASVFDTPIQSLLRQTIKVLGLDDPNQVMAFGTPLETGVGTGGLIDALASKFPKAAAAIKAFHGSPHDFEKFDVSKIGTGEGAQAYGHGLYFAEAEGTAKSYRDQLSRAYSGSPEALAQDALKSVGGDTQAATAKILKAREASARIEQIRAKQRPMIDAPVFDRPAYDALERQLYDLQQTVYEALPNAPTGLGHHEFTQQTDAALAALRSGKPLQGRMYEVAIKAHPDQFLDWDKPLSQQAPAVQKAFEELPIPMRERWKESGAWPEHVHGSTLYKELESARGGVTNPSAPTALRKGGPVASETLKQAGIPGIKYLDQGSRPMLEDVERGIQRTTAKVQSLEAQYKANPTEAIANRLSDARQELQSAHRASSDLSRNYVVFDDATIEILRKYGILPPLAGSALYGQSEQKQ